MKSLSCPHDATQEEVAGAANAIAILGGKLLGPERVDSWSPDGQRTAVVVRKVTATAAKYPRAPGMPNKRPL
jgi:16S rRNA (guanine527-N7)-methyltransferase